MDADATRFNPRLIAVFRLKSLVVLPDQQLPDTAVDDIPREKFIERERLLSPIFISSPKYGTRSSIIILIDRESRVTFSERIFTGKPEPTQTVTRHFLIEN